MLFKSRKSYFDICYSNHLSIGALDLFLFPLSQFAALFNFPENRDGPMSRRSNPRVTTAKLKSDSQ